MPLLKIIHFRFSLRLSESDTESLTSMTTLSSFTKQIVKPQAEQQKQQKSSEADKTRRRSSRHSSVDAADQQEPPSKLRKTSATTADQQGLKPEEKQVRSSRRRSAVQEVCKTQQRAAFLMGAVPSLKQCVD